MTQYLIVWPCAVLLLLICLFGGYGLASRIEQGMPSARDNWEKADRCVALLAFFIGGFCTSVPALVLDILFQAFASRSRRQQDQQESQW